MHIHADDDKNKEISFSIISMSPSQGFKNLRVLTAGHNERKFCYQGLLFVLFFLIISRTPIKGVSVNALKKTY